jgi:Family of unknown function (DUF5686)/CarboxypepD_reg-like domain
MVKGTTIGTTSNAKGEYFLTLSPGNYTIICQYVGYIKEEKTITVGQEELHLNFVLKDQRLSLTEVIVKSDAEDPAYEIIRNAIKKRAYYQGQVEEFQCEVYIKGQLRLRDFPKTFFGQVIEFEDGDTSKNKMVFLSETVAKYSYLKPDKEKVEVLSTRVSGQTNSFGFSDAEMISFYENNVQLGSSLNPRGFISPIAETALNFYRYKFLGAFFEDGVQVNRIKVIPKRNYEPAFAGDIYITENDWRIHSLNLHLTKQSQMELIDSLRIEQLYVPVEKDIWMVKSQAIYPTVDFFGFDGFGYFVSVYSKYNLRPAYRKKFFDRTILKIDSVANKRPPVYWDSIRPVPLLPEEVLDYRIKDSLEKLREAPAYLDSLDRRQNRLTPVGLLLTGQSFSRRKKKTSFEYHPLIKSFGFNTAEGWMFRVSGTFTKRFEGRKNLRITPVVRYGFSNKHLNVFAISQYSFGKKYHNSFGISGGKRVYQFNNINPIPLLLNSISTLFRGKNYMKTYEAWFGNLQYTRGLGEGFNLQATISYQDRTPLENTDTTTYWGKAKNEGKFTPNYPIEIASENISPHQALVAGIRINYRPGTRYIELPDRKINVGSRYPLFSLSYAKGIHKLFGSDVDFDRWRFSIRDEMNFKLAGEFRYHFILGGFLTNNKVELPDYQHFNGNQVLVATPYLNSFQLAPYYLKSSKSNLFWLLHAEHHFNGFLTNKIPLFKRLNLRLVGGVNGFYVGRDNYYYEFMAGLENILKLVRVDYVFGYTESGFFNSKIRIGIRAFTSEFEEY